MDTLDILTDFIDKALYSKIVTQLWRRISESRMWSSRRERRRPERKEISYENSVSF